MIVYMNLYFISYVNGQFVFSPFGETDNMMPYFAQKKLRKRWKSAYRFIPYYRIILKNVSMFIYLFLLLW